MLTRVFYFGVDDREGIRGFIYDVKTGQLEEVS